jgi:RNA polymerase sigma factor (sigma-70 family)
MANMREHRYSRRKWGSGTDIARDDTGTSTETFVVWCHRHGPAVHAYLARRAGRQAADDLFGEVWLRAFSARDSYDALLGGPLPWLYGIAGNVLRAHWRACGRTQALPLLAPTDPWDEADDRLDAVAQLACLRSALGALTDEEREVLLLVAWERLTPTEVARTLCIPPGTARSRLHRARLVMRDKLDIASTPNDIAVCTTRQEMNR